MTIHKKIFGSGRLARVSDRACPSNLALRTTLIISKKEINDIMKIIEESGLLIKGISGTIKNEAKEQKVGFLSMLLDILGASLLGNLLTGKSTIGKGEVAIRAGQDF